MRTIVVFAATLIPLVCFAERLVHPVTGEIVARPKVLREAGVLYAPPSTEQLFERGWRDPTAQEIADKAAAEAAAQAEAEAQRVAALAGSYGGAVAVLQANLVTVGWSIPCDAKAVTADLMGRAHAKTLTEEQREAKDDIFQAYFLLQTLGVSNADIAAIWALIGGAE